MILVIHHFSVFVGVIVGVLLANPCTEEVHARSFVVFVHSCVRTFTGLFIQVGKFGLENSHLYDM